MYDNPTICTKTVLQDSSDWCQIVGLSYIENTMHDNPTICTKTVPKGECVTEIHPAE